MNVHDVLGTTPDATMLELERTRVAPGAPDDPAEINHRLSSYVSLVWALDDRISVNAVSYFQPRWDRPRDYRFLLDGGFTVTITRRLSAKLVLGLRRDNEPPTGVLRTDAELKNALSLQL